MSNPMRKPRDQVALGAGEIQDSGVRINAAIRVTKAPPLSSEQVNVLLEKLSTDESFRQLFVSDLSAAFVQLPGSPVLPSNLTPGCCLKPQALAPMEQIAKTRELIRAKMLGSMSLIVHSLEDASLFPSK